MGLETANFIQDLVAANPLGGDFRSQGDDHLRLIKQVLKNSFPTADRAFYFDSIRITTGDTTVGISDDHATIVIDANGAPRTATMPTLGTDDIGWSVVIMKANNDANPIFASGGGNFHSDATTVTFSKIRMDVPYRGHRFVWSGSEWWHMVPGTVGTIELFLGSTIPFGFASAAGQSLVRADHPELFNIWGTTHGAVDGTHFNAPDLRDRFPAFTGGAYALGATGGENTHALTTAELATHNHGITEPNAGAGHDHTVNKTNFANVIVATPSATTVGAGGIQIAPVTLDVTVNKATTGITINNNGSGTPHENRPPYYALRPIFRLC